MAIAYDTAAQVSGSGVGSITTGSFTVGSGSNRAFHVGVGANQGPSTTSVTCATVSATQSGARTSNGSTFIENWYGVAPSTGSQTCNWTLSATWGTGLSLHVVTFTGVDQTTPTSDRTTATGTGTALSVTVTNAASGDVIIDYAYGGGGGTLVAGANQTERGTTVSNRNTSTQDGADGGAMTWTGQFTQAWIVCGLRMLAASVGSGGGRHAALCLVGCG